MQVAKQVADSLVVSGTGEVTLGNAIGSLIALAGYAVVPFTAAESVGTALWSNVFHVVVAVPVIVALTRYLPSERV